MAETKTKKIRIYKLASEYNLSSESLVEFLRDKGYKVKSHMSIVNDEMMKDIRDNFKKDIEKAEKHYKKIAEFQQKMAEKTSKDERSATIKKEEEEAALEEEELEEETAEDEDEEIEDEESVEEEDEELPEEEEEEEETGEEDDEEEETGEEVDEAEVEETEDEEVEEAVETGKDEKNEEKEKAGKEEKKEKKKEEPETADNRRRPKGLKVLGKIDLDEDKKKKPSKKKKDKQEESAKKKSPVPPVADDDEKDGRKKKKKRRKKRKGEAEGESGKRKRKSKKFEIDEKEVQESIRRTMMSMDESASSSRQSAKKKRRKEREEREEKQQEQAAEEKQTIEVTEYIAVSELANLMNVPVSEVIQKCISLGLMVSINQRLEEDTITLVADEFGFEVEFAKEYRPDELEDEKDEEKDLKSRSAVVTIMGHVDHGKTSLLDHIRSENVVAGESGGITQHIGAYKVEVDKGKFITFLDTPGHEAFTAMRARGAQATDIVVLIVAADDAVMPQTIEAISHAQAANVPIIVAINKIDKPNANTEKIKQQLADKNILVEDWGGKYQCVEISAKSGQNVDQLLEKILLEAEILELKANPDRNARGVVIESEIDKGRGVTATVLVQKGVLNVGDPFIAGQFFGRVRAMFDERNNKVDEAGPSTPVLVLGFEGAPQAGDTFIVTETERIARDTSTKRQQLKREQEHKQVHHVTLDEISKQISIGGVKELPIIVKADVDGSVEALADSLMKLGTEEVVVKVIHRGVGAISENDVLLANASGAIIVGFHVRPNLNARKMAEKEKVDIRIYHVIYDAVNEVKSALEGLLSPIISEEVTSTVEVRDIFKVPKAGMVAGCYVLDGTIHRNDKVRLIRDNVEIYDGEISSLKRFKDDVREVEKGYECGISIENYNDIKVGDVIEGYKVVETKKKLK